MRKIKFRVWYKTEKRMMSWEEICKSGEFTHDFLNQEFADTSPPMQYTCKKDKNDKEIYEGDIVQAEVSEEYTDSKIFMQGEVIYYEPFASFEIKTKDSGQPTMSVFTSFKVLGNKFENPELLE